MLHFGLHGLAFFWAYLCSSNSMYATLSSYFFFGLVVLIRFLTAVIAVDLKQTVQVDKDLQIRAYYAGHVMLLNFINRLHSLLRSMFALT